MAIMREVLVTLRKFKANPLHRRNVLYNILKHDTVLGQPLSTGLPQRVETIVAALRAGGCGE